MDSPPPDLLSWAFWVQNSATVRDILVGLAAPVAFITAIAALNQARIARKRHEEQTKADRERRITDSFTKAVELLGKPEQEVRLGAIYALERIAYESERDHWPIMETLTAYVRAKSPVQDASQSNQCCSSIASAYAMVVAEGTIEAAKEKLNLPSKDIGISRGIQSDIRAVLIVITRRNVRYEHNKYTKLTIWVILNEVVWSRIIILKKILLGSRTRRRGRIFIFIKDIKELLSLQVKRRDNQEQYINLSQTDLRGSSLKGASLIGAYLFNTNLRHANLFNADLKSAQLFNTNLSGADLTCADLRQAELERTDLSWSDLSEANLSGAFVLEANLMRADLGKASLRDAFLLNTNLSEARLPKADLRWARLKNVDLRYADLSGADLSGAKLENVKFCRTIMPDGTINDRDCPPEEAPPSPSETLLTPN